MKNNLKLINFIITVWDININPVAIIDEIIALEWTVNLNKVGTFTLQVPLNSNNIAAFQIGNLITKNHYDNKYNKEAYIINYRQITINKDGVETLEIQGQSLLSWLGQRVLTENYNLDDTVENIARTLINNEVINPTDKARCIPNLKLGDKLGYEDKTTFFPNSQYPNLLTSLTSLFTQCYYGMQILMDTQNKQFIFSLYKGKQRNVGNSLNAPVIFSSEMNTIMSEQYTHTQVNFKNVAYVFAQLSNGKNENIIVGTEEGLHRFETGVNAGNPTLNGKQFTLTENNYKTLMTVAGQQSLAQSAITHNLTGKLNMDCELTYKENFDVGDLITIANKSWGLYEDLVVVAVSEQYSVQGIQLQLTFGYPLPTILELINKQY